MSVNHTTVFLVGLCRPNVFVPNGRFDSITIQTLGRWPSVLEAARDDMPLETRDMTRPV